MVVGAEHCHQIRGHDALVGIGMGLGLDLDLELVREQTGRVLELVGLLLGHEESGRLQVAFPHVSDLWELLLLLVLLLLVLLLLVVVVKVVEEWLLADEVVGVVVVGGVVLVVALAGVECVLVGHCVHLKVEVGQVAARQCGVVAVVVVVVVVVVGVVLEVVVLAGH